MVNFVILEYYHSANEDYNETIMIAIHVIFVGTYNEFSCQDYAYIPLITQFSLLRW